MGNLLIRRAMMSGKVAESIDTSPIIMRENVCWSKTAPNTVNRNGFGITIWYPYEFAQEALEACHYWDAANEYMSSNGWTGIRYYIADANTLAAGYSWPSSANYKNVIGKDEVYTDQFTVVKNTLTNMQFDRYSKNSISANGVSFSLPLLDLDDCYAYWYKPLPYSIFPTGVSNGDVIFAGKNTQYYGKKNING